MKVDTVVESYIKTRDEIAALEALISKLKQFQARKEEWLLEKLTAEGVDSFKSEHGTVFTSMFESVTVADSEAFFGWVRENEAWNCLERRASKSEILNIMGDREASGRPNPPPPGLNYTAIKKVGIRRR